MPHVGSACSPYAEKWTDVHYVSILSSLNGGSKSPTQLEALYYPIALKDTSIVL